MRANLITGRILRPGERLNVEPRILRGASDLETRRVVDGDMRAERLKLAHVTTVPSTRRSLSGREFALMIKRILDIGGAFAGLAIAAPALLLIALATWITLGRPVFFRQKRPGLNGRPFTPLKFRTMRAGPGSDDERTTKLGRFLRHTSLDELPQLWNVLRGDMSLVGPRPLLMDYLDLYPPRQALRHDVRPGITGWCQVNGRNSLTWDRKFELDVWYVEHWSLLLDIRILLKTLARVVRRSGVEGPGNRCWPGFLGGGPVLPGTETDPFAGRGR